jgi:RES domain-containing protein
VRVWRLALPAHAALDGEGARQYGGRWNSKGLRAVYTSGHLSLAALELLAHLHPDEIPRELRAFEIDVPDNLPVTKVNVASLPPDWQLPEHEACKQIGDDWLIRGATPVLAVPSALIPAELNYVINPRHRDASSIAVVATEPFEFNPRVLR